MTVSGVDEEAEIRTGQPQELKEIQKVGQGQPQKLKEMQKYGHESLKS
jgi:hypothetical protein